MKAYVYETFEQLGRIPANIVIPVGNGTLFIAPSSTPKQAARWSTTSAS